MPTLLGHVHDSVLDSTSTDPVEGLNISVGVSGNKVLSIMGGAGIQSAAGSDWAYIEAHADSAKISASSTFTRGVQEYVTGGTNVVGWSTHFTDAPTTDVGMTWEVDATGDLNAHNLWHTLWDIEDIKSDTTQFVEALNAALNEECPTTYADITGASIEVTPNEADEYWLIMGTATLDIPGSSTNASRLRMHNAADAVLAHGIQTPQSNSGDPETSIAIAYLLKSTGTTAETYNLQSQHDAAAGNVEGFHLFAIRLASLSGNFKAVGENGGLTTYEIGTADTPEIPTGATMALTPSGSNDVILMTGGVHDQDVGNAGIVAWFSDDDNTSKIPSDFDVGTYYDGQQAGDEPSFRFDAEVSTPSGAKSYDVYVQSGNADASVHNMWAIALEADGGDGGYVAPTGYSALRSNAGPGQMIITG